MTEGAALTLREQPSIRAGLVRFPAGLHETEASLDLAEHNRKIPAFLRGETGQDLLLLALQPRDQLLVQCLALSRHAQPELAAVVFIFDAFHQLPFHQRRDRAADGGFVGSGAMRNILRAAGFVAEAERRQHAPFRNIQPVALLIFARKRSADLGGQSVQPEWHKSEQIECCQKTAPMGVDAETSEAFRWLQMRLS